MYWLRLEQGTKNPLLNIAYLTMKKENHQWRRDIEYFLWKMLKTIHSNLVCFEFAENQKCRKCRKQYSKVSLS